MAKIIFDTRELKNAFAQIGAAIGDGKTVPTSKNIYFAAAEDDNRVLIKASNMYLRAQVSVECNQRDVFDEFAVEGKSFAAFVKKLSEDEVTVIVSDKAVTLKTEKVSVKLATIKDRADKMETAGFALVAKIKNKDFRAAVAKTMVVSEKNETRPVMAAINFTACDDGFEAQACGLTRFAAVRLADGNFTEKFSHLITTEALATLLSMSGTLTDEDEIEFWQANGRSALFKFGNVTVFVRLLSDSPIEKNKILPPEYKINITVDTAELKGALETVLLATAGGITPIKINLTTHGEMEISTISTTAECAVTVPYSGGGVTEDFLIGFNANYIYSLIKTFADEEIEIGFNTSITAMGVRGENHVAICLPVRLRA